MSQTTLSLYRLLPTTQLARMSHSTCGGAERRPGGCRRQAWLAAALAAGGGNVPWVVCVCALCLTPPLGLPACHLGPPGPRQLPRI
jgi:hypothetical protein